MRLLDSERATYRDLWGAVPSYAENSPGEDFLPVFLSLVGEQRGTVLDAGIGSGKGALALERVGFRVTGVDVTDAGLLPDARTLPFVSGSLWHSLGHIGWFDWVYCTDVLEHLPPQFTMLAVDQTLRVARRGLFLSVSLVPDHFGIWMGKALHQTVQPFTWWKESLGELGRVTDARDLLAAATFYVEPR